MSERKLNVSVECKFENPKTHYKATRSKRRKQKPCEQTKVQGPNTHDTPNWTRTWSYHERHCEGREPFRHWEAIPSMYNAICVVYSFRIQKESNLFFATIEYSFININIFSVSRCSFIFWFGSARYQKETYHIVVLIFPYCTSYYNPILWTLIGHYCESHLQNGHRKSFIVPIIIYIL